MINCFNIGKSFKAVRKIFLRQCKAENNDIKTNIVTINKQLPDDAYMAYCCANTPIYFSPSKKTLYVLNDLVEDFVQFREQDLRRLLEILDSTRANDLPAGRRPKFILLAEDDVNVNKKIIDKVKDAFANQVQIISFIDGKPAYEFFEIHAEYVDLIISCIVMPELDGIKLLKLCKKLRPTTPYILFTALDYRDDFDVQDAQAYIVKQADFSELISNIKILLNL